MPDRDQVDGESPVHASLWSWTYGLLIMGAFFEALSFTSLYPALPRLVTRLDGYTRETFAYLYYRLMHR